MVYAPADENSKPIPGVHPDYNGAFAVNNDGVFFCGNENRQSFVFSVALAAWRKETIQILSEPDTDLQQSKS
jgi:hypothetical protein